MSYKMKLLIFTLVILFSLTTTLFARSIIFVSIQIPDRIKYEGKEYNIQMNSNPLDSYFEKYPDKNPGRDKSETGSEDGVSGDVWGGYPPNANPALLKGYVAIFSINNQMLQLDDIEIPLEGFKDKWKSVIYDVVPENEMLNIDWFTGILVLLDKDIISEFHMYNEDIYTDDRSIYTLLEIKEGKITDKREFNEGQYEAFKDRQFTEYKKTNEYKKLSEELKKNEWEQDWIDHQYKNPVISYASEFLDE